MIVSKGKNDFVDGRFDRFRWSAHIYETPEEILERLASLGICRKKIAGISAIGALNRSVGHWESEARDLLRDAGIVKEYSRRENTMILHDGRELRGEQIRELLSKVRVELCLTLYEPLLISFEDGTVLELLPLAGKGLQIGFGSLPRDMRDGLNRAEIDIGDMFDPVIGGMHFCDLKISDIHETRTYSYRQEKKTFRSRKYIFGMPHGKLVLEESQASEYILYCTALEKIRCEQLYAIIKPSRQEMILEGCHRGGAMNVFPAKEAESKAEISDEDPNLSISFYYSPPKLLERKLIKYYDKELELNKQCMFKHYDDYDNNYYTIDSMLRILEEVKEESAVLEKADMKVQWETLFKNYKVHAEDEKRRMISEELDFTRRVIRRLEAMVNTTEGYPYICFEGP